MRSGIGNRDYIIRTQVERAGLDRSVRNMDEQPEENQNGSRGARGGWVGFHGIVWPLASTANIGFFMTRLMLLCGQFNYGKKGILDATHTRLFTFRSLRELLKQSDYQILEIRGIPAPFPKAIGDNFFSRFLVRLNALLIRLSRGLFAYQIFVRAQARPAVHHLLRETIDSTVDLRRETLVR